MLKRGVSQFISVILPCRNERKNIERSVRAILASTHENFEVIVVDGQSDDGTRDILRSLSMQDPRVKIVDNPKKLTAFALNIGVVHARGEFVQIVGARQMIAPDYLALLLKIMQSRADVVCAGGSDRPVADSPWGEVMALALESKFGVGASNYRTMRMDCYVDTVGVPMYRTSVFREIGTFDERLTQNQEDEFHFRLEQKGRKIFYVHNAKVTYLVSGSLKESFRQSFQRGYIKVFVNQLHGVVTTSRQMIPAAFVAFWVVFLPWAGLLPGLRPVAGFIALLYALTGLVMAGRKVGLIRRFQVLFACFVLHLGYGLGYWAGIWNFLIKKREP